MKDDQTKFFYEDMHQIITIVMKHVKVDSNDNFSCQSFKGMTLITLSS